MPVRPPAQTWHLSMTAPPKQMPAQSFLAFQRGSLRSLPHLICYDYLTVEFQHMHVALSK